MSTFYTSSKKAERSAGKFICGILGKSNILRFSPLSILPQRRAGGGAGGSLFVEWDTLRNPLSSEIFVSAATSVHKSGQAEIGTFSTIHFAASSALLSTHHGRVGVHPEVRLASLQPPEMGSPDAGAPWRGQV
ncbi:hypothetical protein JTE90_021159 [Oedothorax gibbosus]|uniref:Uncharacterized protein n=1 Tax=Oedothorax gibbosus TaxID=931172 RepID=A0AAV6U1N1_9ARAC|nr:hypothetical protein JTE90_021159 [Oedothorax gibbosus]